MAGETKLDLNALVQSYTGSPEEIAKIRKQLEKEFAIDFTVERVYDPSIGAMNDIYKDQRAKAIVENRAFIDRYISANKELAQVTSAGMVADAPTALASGYTAVNINGINAWRDGSGAIFLEGASSAAARDTAKAFMKTNDEERGKLQQWNAATAASPQANAEAVLGDLRKISLQRTIAAEDRAAAMAEAAANRASSVALAQTATVQTIITTKIDQSTGKEVWVVRQILKNGTTQDTLYNPTPADRAKALYTASDGSIGTLGEDNQISNWTYRPPLIVSEGENKYTVDWDAKLQNYDTSKRIQIAKPGQKLEFWNGKVYRTSTDDKGNYKVEEVAGVPPMSKAEADRLKIEERNVEISADRQKSDALKDAASIRLIEQQMAATTAAQSTVSDIIAGKANAALGLIKSGTAADLAKAQELYQSARKDWEAEKKNATDRRDKAQEKGLRRSGMMFLRGATAVQGGKTGADAQKMWKEEYNRTPGKEGETYTERMARSQGLGADLDQNLDTTFPTMADWIKGATANPNASANPQSVVTKTVAPVSTVPPVPPVPTVPPAFNPNIDPKTAIATRPSGTVTGRTNAAGYQTDTFPTVSPNGAGPGDVPAQSLNQGQVAVAPSNAPSYANQTGLNPENGSYAPMQVPVAMAPSREMSNDLEPARLSSNYQNGGQGYFGTPSAPVGSPELRATWDEDGKQGYSEEPKESDMDKLARIHNQLNGGRGGM